VGEGRRGGERERETDRQTGGRATIAGARAGSGSGSVFPAAARPEASKRAELASKRTVRLIPSPADFLGLLPVTSGSRLTRDPSAAPPAPRSRRPRTRLDSRRPRADASAEPSSGERKSSSPARREVMTARGSRESHLSAPECRECALCSLALIRDRGRAPFQAQVHDQRGLWPLPALPPFPETFIP
jgi:hypothetical protein